MAKLLQALARLLDQLLFKGDNYQTPITVLPPLPPPEAPKLPVEVPKPVPKYLWDTPINVRHSVRVICDEEGLTLPKKELITACIKQESGFNNAAICANRDKYGQVWSRDWGICQINDWFHIGKGKSFPSVAYVVNNPDKVVRFMISMYRKGQLKQWVSYSSGAYKKHLPPGITI